MKVKARSIVRGNLIGTLVWILGVAVLNVIVYLIFGESNITVSLIVISIVGLFFRLLSSCHVIFCALTNRDIEITDDKDSAEKSNQKDNNRHADTGNEDVKTESDEKPDDNNGSIGLGIFLLIIIGVVLTLIGIINLKKEIRIFITEPQIKSQFKSQGKSTLGTILATRRRFKSVGTRGRTYTYYLHTIRYDGFEKTYQNLNPIAVDTTVPVIYMPNKPEETLIGEPSQSVSDFKESIFKESRFKRLFSLGFGFMIYLTMIIIGSGMILLIIVRGIQAVLKK